MTKDVNNLQKNLLVPFVSLDHYRRDLFEFSVAKRKMRRWLKNYSNDKITGTLELVNHFCGIQNTFTNKFVNDYIEDHFLLEERKIANTIIGNKKEHHGGFRRAWQMELENVFNNS